MTCPFRPTALRTEYRVDPLGIDTPAPRLSWQLAAVHPETRGAEQSGYAILVATDRSLLRPGIANLWDSGTVSSKENTHQAYAGRPLSSRMHCWWRVRVCDSAGAWSSWSEPACWTMGLLDPREWTARWIGTGESLEKGPPARPQDNTLQDPWLRRCLVLDAPPARATAFVASVGFHELYVNGVKAGCAVLVPSVTDHTRRARYVAYEIGPLLRFGQNVIGLWLGTGWSIFSQFVTADKPRAPIVLGQFEIDLVDGRALRIVTDGQWKAHASPSRLLGSWDFKAFGGEHYDARRDLPGWSEPALDEAGWTAAVEYTPALEVSAEPAELNELTLELRPVALQRLGGAYRFDLGRNLAGWIELAVRGRPGDHITIQSSERPDRPMTHGLHSAYVVGSTGRGVFRNRFNYGVGRWITVEGLREAPRLEDLRAWLVRPAHRPASSFRSSSVLLNRIHDTALWTFENLTLGGYVVDCPHRERMGYGGDAYATTWTGLGGYDLGAFHTKWSQDWRDVQGRTPTWGVGVPPGQPGSRLSEKGNVPYTAPTHWGGGGPAWSGFLVYLPWEVYRRYGDERILRENIEAIDAWLSFLDTKSDGVLLRRYGGMWDFLGDWLWPDASDVNGDTRETLFFNNCFRIWNLDSAAAVATILGHAERASRWASQAARAREAVHARFFNPSDASYVNGFQAYLAIALLAGVPPPELRPAVWRRLEHEIRVVRRGHIHAGITGGALLFQCLMESGRDDLIWSMVSREDAPSWGAMLRAGATTFWEGWSTRSDSLLHSSFLFVGAWFVHGVLGIQPDPEVPGFRRFVVRPGLLDCPELRSAEGHHDCIHGRIVVAWRRDGTRCELDLRVPPNTRAQVYLPAEDERGIREGGGELPQAEGVRGIIAAGQGIRLEVLSGSYRFEFEVAQSKGGERPRLEAACREPCDARVAEPGQRSG